MFKKYSYYRKYRDEVWGHLIRMRKYNNTKKSVLFNYKNLLLKKRLKIKTKYNYYRRLNFLKKIKGALFTNKFLTKTVSLKNYILKKRAAVFNWKKKNFVNLVLKNPTKKIFFFKPFSKISLGFRYNIVCNNIFARKFSIFFWARNRIQFLLKKKTNLKTYKVFFYKTYMVIPQVKRKTTSLFSLKTQYYRKLSLFYGFTNPRQFFLTYKRFLVNTKNSFFSLFSLLEGRLQVALFRLNFVPNVYFAKQIILHKNVYVNNRVINSINYIPKYNEIISLNKKYFKLFYFNLYRLLRKRSIFLNFPCYYDVDYKLLTAVLIKLPKISNLSLPFSSTSRYLSNVFSFARL